MLDAWGCSLDPNPHINPSLHSNPNPNPSPNPNLNPNPNWTTEGCRLDAWWLQPAWTNYSLLTTSYGYYLRLLHYFRLLRYHLLLVDY